MCRLLLTLSLLTSIAHAKESIQSISIETGRSTNGQFIISGRDTGQQLLVSGKLSNGEAVDLTRKAIYEASPKGIVTVDKTGWVVGVQEGVATIRIQADDGLTASTKVKVTNIATDIRLNFANDVVPIMTRYGCNSGGCHGKADGQNGFKLSLLGFEPQEDFEHIVKEARGRRVYPAAPAYSLLLRKATGQIAHGGGSRIPADSPSYRIIRRWIEQGLPYGKSTDPTVTKIQVLPKERILKAKQSQQLVVVAHYSDGSTRDVTRTAQFELNDPEMGTVSETGIVTAKELTGTAGVMVRYQANVDVFLATMPLGAPVTNLPKAANFVDTLVFNRLKKLGLPPSAICDDSVFLRRVTLDICGRLPTLEETKKFLADASSEKRAKLIDRLLDSGDYADYFANKWGAILRNRRELSTDDPKSTIAFHKWIRESFEKNKPFDQFVKEILTASGKEISTPQVSWYREVKDQIMQAEDTAQLFLGQRIQCARCHHHPFEKWSQKDYYGFAAFFSQVKYKLPPQPVKQKGKKKKKKKKGKPVKPLTEIYHQVGLATAKHPRSGETIRPMGLGGKELAIEAKIDPRVKLAEWMTSSDNPFFARMLVNRYWKHFFGRGLVDPEDDMRLTNPATNPELLDALALHFKKKFDLKDLIRTICNSKTYQLSAKSNQYNANDKQSFSRYQPRRLSAEVLLDAIDSVTLSKTVFRGMPQTTRAVQLPDNAFDSYFLSVFGRPDASSACECERSSDTGLPQLLHLLNSSTIEQKVAGRRAITLAKERRSEKEKIRELYLIALSREPSDKELSVLTGYIEKKGTKNAQTAYADILWALINGEEFLYNH